MSLAAFVVKSICGRCKTDFWVWLDKYLGDFSHIELNPVTYLVTTENIKGVESLCRGSDTSFGCSDVIFTDVASSDIYDIGLTEDEQLVIGQFLKAKNDGSTPLVLAQDAHKSEGQDDTLECFTKSPEKESTTVKCRIDAEIQTSNVYWGNDQQGPHVQNTTNKIEKRKLDYLKSYERIILFKTMFVFKLNHSDLITKHKSPSKAPVLTGSRNSIEEAELGIMKFIRRIIQQEIKFSDEMTCKSDEASRMHVKIMSCLENKFQNDPLCFEMEKDRITVYSVEAEKLEEFRNYFDDHFYVKFVPVVDTQKFKYIETRLKNDVNALVSFCDDVRIVAKHSSDGMGYTFLGFGNKSDFEELVKKLERIINHIESAEITLNVPNISENLDLIMAGIEQRWNVMVKVLNHGSATGIITQASIKGISVVLVDGRIEDQNVDIIINSAGKDLNLNSGPLSKAIALKAGEDLQKECNSKKDSLTVGQVVESRAYNLPSKFIFHCLAKHWNKHKPEESQEILAKIVQKCLEMAISKNATSIAFPPVNSGFLQMPAKISAECIFGAIDSFKWEVKHTLKIIRIAIYDPKNSTFQEFQQTLNENLNKPHSSWKYAEGVKVSIISSDEKNLERAYLGLRAATQK